MAYGSYRRGAWGRSRPRTALFDKRCAGCGGIIKTGAQMCFDSKPIAKATYHVDCASVDTLHADYYRAVEATESVDEEAAIEADEPEGAPEAKRETRERDSGADDSLDSIVDKRIRIALGSFKPSEAVTADKARDIAETIVNESKSALQALIDRRVKETIAPQKVEFVFKDGEKKPVKIEGAHWILPRIVTLVRAGFHVCLYGPAGTGKTTMAAQAAEALKRTHDLDTLDASTFKSAVLGFMNAAGKPVDTIFTCCYREGSVYIADELDAAPANVQTLFNSALANGLCPTPWAKGGIKRADTFAFIGTCNTPLRPTPEFPDRKPGSAAFKDRLYFVYIPQDEAIECRAAGLPAPPPPERQRATCEPGEWVRWVQSVRRWVASNPTPGIMTGQRQSLDGLKALAIGESPREAADGLMFRGADQPLIDKILRNCPLPGRAI